MHHKLYQQSVSQSVLAKVEVTLRLTVNQGVEHTLGLVTKYYFLSESCCLVFVVRPL
jgi:hypothetical protein